MLTPGWKFREEMERVRLALRVLGCTDVRIDTEIAKATHAAHRSLGLNSAIILNHMREYEGRWAAGLEQP